MLKQPETVTIKVPADLMEKLKAVMGRRDYASVQEAIVDMLDDIASNWIENDMEDMNCGCDCPCECNCPN